MTSAGAAEVIERRSLGAPPESVWRALTTAEAVSQWFWPARLEAAVELDARVGGRYRIASPVADMAVSGHFTALDAPDRLGFTWQWDGGSCDSTVTIELAGVGDGTELALTHSGLADLHEVTNHVQGWSDCLDRLAAWLPSA